ncbi:hypothetical protein FAZ95_02450 [Trinickia violacea]|uniref:Uncharacterized protein n=1 Tax=Trinickia violacea TaxID=2571746 RepID=A0A4P8IHL9_9BURK|nr:hypothetical protein [Trinickia violacea]QCP48148.1 hypothetical protein FAZ95_02450 [Trinickia violacea]
MKKHSSPLKNRPFPGGFFVWRRAEPALEVALFGSETTPRGNGWRAAPSTLALFYNVPVIIGVARRSEQFSLARNSV